MNNNEAKPTLPALSIEQLTTVTGGFGWKDLVSVAVLSPAVAAPVGLAYGAKALYNHGRATGAEC